MKDMGIVYGSKAQALPTIFNHDTVYVHSDIQKVENEEMGEVYQYHEYQMTINEYVELQGSLFADYQDKTAQNTADIDYIKIMEDL